jgi:UDP-N-acetylmuramyl pentapeptide synthase
MLLTVGGRSAEALGRAAVEAGMDAGAVVHAATSMEAAELAAGLVAPGDVVLVKGSRGVKTDLVVDRLAAVFA